MPRAKIALCISLFLFVLSAHSLAQSQSAVLSPQPSAADLPKSRAELTNYEETTRYEEVLSFIAELQKRSPLLRLESFGTSEEGRKLPLMIFSLPSAL